MGPLIPQGFINADLNLFFAFVIGLGFGYVLEQGGFSNARKLAGVFYGYDFVVLRVFFTAAITAALGLLLFQYIGWIDYDLLYINPTFLWSILIGGAIMGLGFILGGFCPGTSVVAAVIGKIDAMVFVIGLLIGVFLFGTFYDSFHSIYTAKNLGSIFVYDSLGLSREWFVFLLVVVALAAFVITRNIEDSVNNIKTDTGGWFHPSYRLPFALMLGLALLVLILPQAPTAKWYQKDAKTLLQTAVNGEQYTEANEVAYKLLHSKANDLMLVDVRSAEDFAQFSFPGALHIDMEHILTPNTKKLLKSTNKQVVLYSFSSAKANQAWMLLAREGLTNIRVLKGGLNGFFDQYFGQNHETESLNEMDQFYARFGKQANEAFKTGQAAEKTVSRKKAVTTIVEMEAPPAGSGGC